MQIILLTSQSAAFEISAAKYALASRVYYIAAGKDLVVCTRVSSSEIIYTLLHFNGDSNAFNLDDYC